MTVIREWDKSMYVTLLSPKHHLNQSQGTVYKIAHTVSKVPHSGKLRTNGESQGGTGETARQVRALAALSENHDLIPSFYIVAHRHCNSSFMGSNGLFWPWQAPGLHVVHRQTQRQNTYTYKHLKRFYGTQPPQCGL